MARISLASVLNESFINRFTGVATKGAGGVSRAAGGGASQVSIGDGLRVGAQTFSTSVKALNGVLSVFNVADTSLSQLEKLTEKLTLLAEEATRSGLGQDRRGKIRVEFADLGKEFELLMENAQAGGREYLKLDDLKELMTLVGLSAEDSEAVAQVVARFDLRTGDDSLVSPRAPKEAAQDEDAGDPFSVRALETPKRARETLEGLQELAEQIRHNRQGIAEARNVVGKNMELVRAAGFAFLNLSEQIGSSEKADAVAKKLRQDISRNAPAALSQAGNLESLVVAALTLDGDKLN